MKLDPNKYCVNFKQNLGWALIHDIIAHPLMALTLYRAPWLIQFHRYTSEQAWIRGSKLKRQAKPDASKTGIAFKQHLGWALVHDVIAHPLMTLTLYEVPMFIRFHNNTSAQAWIKDHNSEVLSMDLI